MQESLDGFKKKPNAPILSSIKKNTESMPNKSIILCDFDSPMLADREAQISLNLWDPTDDDDATVELLL